MRTFENIAKLIKAKRKEHPSRISQTALSQLLGYKNGQFISNVERGLCSIPLKGMQKTIEVLNVSSEDIKEAMLNDYKKTLDYYLSMPTDLEETSAKVTAEDNFNNPSF